MNAVAALAQAVRGKKVLIDSNIIIYLTDLIQPYAAVSQRLFNMVETGETHAVISILSVGEVMQGPIRKGYIDVALAVKDYLVNFPHSHCQELSMDILDIVGRDDRVAWEQLRTVDSLIIASGLYRNVDLFVSNDLHFINAIPADMMVSFQEQG